MSLTILLDGEDISGRITGAVNVRREERAAGQATFVWAPDLTVQLAPVLLDNFNDPTGTLLQDHTPDTGPQWQRAGGTITIRDASGNIPQGARSDINENNQYVSPVTLPSTYFFTCDAYFEQLGSNRCEFYIAGLILGFDRNADFVIRDEGGPTLHTETMAFSTGDDLLVRLVLEIVGHNTLNWQVREGDSVSSTPVSSGTLDISSVGVSFNDIYLETEGRVVFTFMAAEEPAASPGPPPPQSLIRKQVQISYSGERIFTGLVNDAVWNLYDRVYDIDCSDMFQEVFEGLTPAQIVALIPGSYWSEAVFGLEEDGWSTAQDAMSTVPIDVYLNRSGVYTTTPWAAKATPDLSLGEGQIINGGAYSLDLAKGRDLVTQFNIELSYEFSRWKMRFHDFAWSYLSGSGVSSFCDYLAGPLFPVPSKETVIQAAAGTGWPVYNRPSSQTAQIAPDGFGWTLYPEGGDFCGGPIWAIDEHTRQLFCMGARWVGYRLFAQTIKEKYEITLDALATQVPYGSVARSSAATVQIEVDDAVFEKAAVPPSTDEPGWAQDNLADWRQDQDDEAIRTNDLECAIATGRVAILESFRGNELSVETIIDPTADLNRTVEVTTRDIQAKGKLRAIEHRIDLNQAVTRLSIAISTGAGGSDGSFSAPARPNTDPVHTAPPVSTSLPTRLGGCGNSPPYDDTWDGWSTNIRACTPEDGGPPTESEQVYPYRFKVTGPDVEDEAREDFEATSVSAVEVAVPQDTLVLL